jgi:outer membrane protein assembly factor BamB
MRRKTGWLLILFLIAAPPASGEDWPQFRGPGGQGHSAEKGLPLNWSDDGKVQENIAWKTAVPGLGWSSPVVRGARVWITTALDGGRSLRALCFDAATGEILKDVEVFHQSDPGQIHAKNSHASPTPVLEGDRVYVHFGAHGTACLSMEGKVLWKQVLRYAHRHGPAGSPVLFGRLLIVSCDGTDVQFVAALDAETGEVRWKKDRSGPMAYSTPLVARVGGEDQAVSTGGNRAAAYDPRSGEEIWSVRYQGYSLVPRPVHGLGLFFLCTGFDSPSIIALREGGRGDITDTHLAWTRKRGAPLNPSPILVGDDLYFVNDHGVLTCLEARTGSERGQARLEGEFSASPLYADGRLYFLNEEGTATVVEPGAELKKLAVNRVEGRTLASPAVSGGAILLRTDKHLLRIEAKRR